MGQLYAGVALVELAAALTGNLTFAAIFGLGLGLDSKIGLGLPFLVSTVSLVIQFVSLLQALELSKACYAIKLIIAA